MSLGLAPDDRMPCSVEEVAAEAVVGEEELEAAVVKKVAVGKLSPSPFQPRQQFGTGDLAQLVASIKQAGVLEPLLVRQVEGGRYEIIAGERRWRAAQVAGMKSVPCLVLEVDDTQARLIGLIENLHRRDLSDYERGRALKQIKEALGVTWRTVGERVGLRKASVLRLVKFAELPADLEETMGGRTSARHYEALALLNRKPKQQAELARAIGERQLKGPEARRAAQAIKDGKARTVDSALRQATGGPARKSFSERTEDEVAKVLGDLMKMGTRLRGTSGRGLTATQRLRLLGGMEALRDDMNRLIEFLRRQGT
jgi:ParB family chromosome partitioning protein